jgi:hypothetical protein
MSVHPIQREKTSGLLCRKLYLALLDTYTITNIVLKRDRVTQGESRKKKGIQPSIMRAVGVGWVRIVQSPTLAITNSRRCKNI